MSEGITEIEYTQPKKETKYPQDAAFDCGISCWLVFLFEKVSYGTCYKYMRHSSLGSVIMEEKSENNFGKAF